MVNMAKLYTLAREKGGQRAADRSGLAVSRDWEHLWVSLLVRDFRSVAVVPCGPMLLAEAVVDGLCDASAALNLGRPRRGNAGEMGTPEAPVLIPLPPLDERPRTVLPAREADGALLVVPIGQVTLRDVRQARSFLGRECMCIALSPAAVADARRTHKKRGR